MSKTAFLLRFCLLAFVLFSFNAYGQTALDLLPADEWMPGWKQSYDVLAYEDDDLFFLINGGADLFLEYGFSDVAAVEYRHPSEGKIYIEVYRMDSDSAAFGVFSLRKGSLQMEINPSPWVVYGEDNLHLWQGPFYISVSTSGLSSLGKLKAFAMLMAHFPKMAPGENRVPVLFGNHRESESSNATYVLGPLGLNNFYHFGHGNILKVTEALAITRDDSREIILNYPDDYTAQKVFLSFSEHLGGSNRYSDYQIEDSELLAKDLRNNTVIARLKGQKILFSVRKPE